MTSQKKLGWGLAALLVAGNMIGSGVYLLPSRVAPVGSSSLIGWIVASIGALALAVMFAGLGRLRPQADGLTDHAGEGLGRFFGYQASLAYWAAGWVGNCAIAVAATGYLAYFFPALEGRWAGALSNVGLICLMTLAYMGGARIVARFGGATLLIGLAPLVIAIVAGFAAFQPEVFSASWNPADVPLTSSVPASLALIFWAFLGVESAGVLAARLKDPERDVGRATLGGVLLAAVVYMADQFGLLIGMTTVLILVAYVLCALALMRFTSSWRWRLAALISLGFCAWAVAASGVTLIWITLGFFALTSVAWLFVRRSPADAA